VLRRGARWVLFALPIALVASLLVTSFTLALPTGGGPNAPSGSSGPTVSVLASYAITTGGWGLSFPLNFTVPNGTDHVLYCWAIGGNFSAFQSPDLPTGMSVATSIGYEGIAVGALTPGTYSTDLVYPGWSNGVSLVVYGVSGDAGYSYQFQSQNHVTNLSLAPGGSVYLGIESTGMTWPVVSPSLNPIDESTYALIGGTTGDIGRQSTGNFSFTTQAGGYGIAAAEITSVPAGSPLPVVQVLASFAALPYEYGGSFQLNFTVTNGTSPVIYAWTIGGAYANYTPPVLPAGMTVAASIGWEGMAVGNLTPGNYTTNLSYTGWINGVSIVVWGLQNTTGYTLSFAAQNMTKRLVMAPGAWEYFGIESTGMTWPVKASSLTDIDAQTVSIEPGFTGLIGRQSSNVLSFQTPAGGYGITAMGLYAPPGVLPGVTVSERGLAPGAVWSVTLVGVKHTTTGPLIGLNFPRHGIFYLRIVAPGYIATPALIETRYIGNPHVFVVRFILKPVPPHHLAPAGPVALDPGAQPTFGRLELAAPMLFA
jgi:hypothetical protein